MNDTAAPTRRRPGRPKDPARRAAMLQAARAAFAEYGYAGASLSSLAERIGLTKAAVLHHFPSKDALYIEVLANTLQSLVQPVATAALTPGDFPTRLDNLTDAIVDELSNKPESAKLLIREILGRGPYMEGDGANAVRGGIAVIVQFLGDGMAEGAFRTQDPAHLAWSIMGLHLLYWAARDVVQLQGSDTSDLTRREEVRTHVRAMTLPPAGMSPTTGG